MHHVAVPLRQIVTLLRKLALWPIVSNKVCNVAVLHLQVTLSARGKPSAFAMSKLAFELHKSVLPKRMAWTHTHPSQVPSTCLLTQQRFHRCQAHMLMITRV